MVNLFWRIEMTATKMIVKMTLEKMTPGAVRYQEVSADGQVVKQTDPGCVFGTIYIRKSGIQGEIPQNICVTVDAEE